MLKLINIVFLIFISLFLTFMISSRIMWGGLSKLDHCYLNNELAYENLLLTQKKEAPDLFIGEDPISSDQSMKDLIYDVCKREINKEDL